MSLPDEPPSPGPPRHSEPMRELLLAQALDACIRAERRAHGAAAAIIARHPKWARAELQRLVNLASSLDKAATNAVISDEFRMAARTRLMQRIGVEPTMAPMQFGPHLTTVPSRNGHHRVSRRRRSIWVWRGSAGLLAAVLAVAATLTASASALPGEPLYSLKQAQEELGVRLASDDQARALALLHRADARLDETARLLQLGRTDEALAMTLRYDQVVERATTAYVVTIDDALEPSPAAGHIDTQLSQQQEQLQSMLQTAPQQARGDLRDALVATERSRALVADPRPVERALGRSSRRDAVAAVVVVPTVKAEEEPTLVPTRRPTPSPPPPVLAEQQHAPLVAQVIPADSSGRGGDDEKGGGAGGHDDGGDGGTNSRPLVANVTSTSGRGVSSGSQQPVRSTNADDGAENDRRTEQTPAQPALVARDDRGSGPFASQSNPPQRNQADGRSNGGVSQPLATDRSREEDAPPPVVARPQTTPAQTSGSGAGTKSSENTAPARPQAPAPAVGAAQTDKGGHDTADDVRGASSTSPALTTRPQTTPTPAVVRKNTSDDKPNPTPASRNAGGDKDTGGGGIGGADHPGR